MNPFNLTSGTVVNKFIPKNAFDEFLNASQKRMLSEKIEKITWCNKLSPHTINLSSGEIQEIQIFHILTRGDLRVEKVLNLIDRFILYHVLFVVSNGESMYVSTSPKHLKESSQTQAVIDWTFESDTFPAGSMPLKLKLSGSLDLLYLNLCRNLYHENTPSFASMKEFLNYVYEFNKIENAIDKLKAELSQEIQFNRKVELNIRLSELLKTLEKYRTYI